MDYFAALTKSSDPVTAILAALVVVLAGVIVFQWNYTANNTVPKWIWVEFVAKVDKLVEMSTIISTTIQNRK